MSRPEAQGTKRLTDLGRRGLTDLVRCLRFFSRLPVPPLPWEADPSGCPTFERLPRMLPLAGAVIGAVGGAVLILALSLNLSPWLSATLAVAALVLATGALHEDGLADTADGFWGGSSVEQRLAIMRDSRIGAFGACALILAFSLRIGAVAALAERLGPRGAAVGLILAAALSRTAALVVLTRLPPARRDGASFAVGRPHPATLGQAGALAAALTLGLGLAGSLPPLGLLLMIALPGLAAATLMRVSRRLIGGQTGDVVGATQQVAEIAAMLGLLIGLGR